MSKALSFYYGDEKICFERINHKTKISKIQIKIYADCHIEVVTPEPSTDQSVLTAVKKRARWIYKQLILFRRQNMYVIPYQYVSGETHLYLGKEYQLKVVETEHEQQTKLVNGLLFVSVREKTAENVQKLLFDWYRKKAKNLFKNRLSLLSENAVWLSHTPEISVQSMRTQWGSCSPQGRIILNPHLIKAPRECIDYVILHELCHIAEHNHSKRFYQLLKQVMPHWEKVKAQLDDMAPKLLNGCHADRACFNVNYQ